MPEYTLNYIEWFGRFCLNHLKHFEGKWKQHFSRLKHGMENMI